MAGAEWAATARRMDDAYDILAAEHPMTIRQLFYRLVSKALIKNCQRHYARVGRDMTKARKDDAFPTNGLWTAVVRIMNPTCLTTSPAMGWQFNEAIARTIGEINPITSRSGLKRTVCLVDRTRDE